MIEQSRFKIVTAFAGDFIQARAIQSVLLENHIQATLENEFMSTIAPWYVSPGGFKPVKVVVRNSDLSIALNIIEEFNRNS